MDDFDRLIRRVSRLTGSAVVGALDEETAQKLRWSEFGQLDDGTVLGRKDIDPRPTLSVVTDRLTPAIDRAMRHQVGRTLDGVTTTGREIVTDLARDVAEETQAQIGNDTPPPLAESTRRRRRREGKDERTLVDTGDMQRGIGAEGSDRVDD